MNQIVFMNMTPAPGTPATYIWLGSVLTVLGFLTLWRELSDANSGVCFRRSFSLLAFVAARTVVVVFAGALVAEHMAPPLMYILLNLVCVYLAAEALFAAQSPGNSIATRESFSKHVERRRTTYFQSAVFALVASLIYSVVPSSSEVSFSLDGLVNTALAAATVRLSVYLLNASRGADREIRPVVVVMVSSMIVSWLLLIGASLSVGSSATLMLQIARGFDILAMVSGLLALQVNYLMMGFYQKTRADTNEEEAQRVKAELSMLNRVAYDIYDDSSSMITRQQAHSRELMRRIKSLESILEICVKIQGSKDLRKLLQMVVELVSEHLGFKTVIVRLLNERTVCFETKAFVGVHKDVRKAVMNHRLPWSEYESLTSSKYKIGNCYFVRREVPVTATPSRGVKAETVATGNQWADIDRLIVPLVDHEKNSTIGYMSIEDPGETDATVVETIDNVEAIATLAVVAIREATHYVEVDEKNRKLSEFTDKLASLNQMKSNFVAAVSHEFRTPLTSIKAYCETLLKNVEVVDRNIMKEFLVVIGEESNRLMTLIEDVLDFSQMESGAVSFERRSCHMQEIIESAVSDLEKNFQRKHITLKRNIPEAEIRVRGERDLIKQLVVSLMHNATKFTPDGGNVWLSLEDGSVSTRIIVEDDGIGISADQLDSVFEHFNQGDNTSTRQYGGTGIGLALCKNIVDWHDGRIWVESAPGQGARFVVVIPKKQVVVRSHVLNVHGALRQFEVERYLEVLVEMVAELMDVRKASVMLADEAGEELRIACAIGMDEEIAENATARIGTGIAGKVMEENRSYLAPNVDNDGRVGLGKNESLYNSSSFLSVPINRNGRVLGVINVANPSANESFDSEDKGLLEAFSDRVAVALERLSEFAGSAGSFEEVRAAFKAMLDSKRFVNDQVGPLMMDILSEVGDRLGMTESERATLLYAFNVYDLGLADSRYNMIRQPRGLNQEDRDNLEGHTIFGTEMLRVVETDPKVRDAVLYHHENYDGTGYPANIAGDEIPIEARIIRIADTFRALMSHRSYQKQCTVAESVDQLRDRAGTFFDPNIVEVFIDVVMKNVGRLHTGSTGVKAKEDADVPEYIRES